MAKGPGTKFTGKTGPRVLQTGPNGKLRPYPVKPGGGGGCASVIVLVVILAALVTTLATRYW